MNPKTEKLATGIMGWHKSRYGAYWRSNNPLSEGSGFQQKPIMATLDWNPWESWNDAMMIVEEMERRGYFWMISRGYTFSSPGDLPPKAKCSFWSGTDPYQCGTYAATSTKEAICEAALRLEEQDET